jgi:WhiB family redox-sensing transcriptional regulator
MSYRAIRWRDAGACATADPDLFFPFATATAAAGAGQIEAARRICAGCQVRQQCLAFAVENQEAHGIWGGTTAEERARERKRPADAGRAAARRADRGGVPAA